MSDLEGYYDTSYPPSLWGGGDGGTTEPIPTLTAVEPSTLVEGVVTPMRFLGSAFKSSSQVRVTGETGAVNYTAQHGIAFVSPTELTMSPGLPIPAWAMAPGSYLVKVKNGVLGDDYSNELPLIVVAAS